MVPEFDDDRRSCYERPDAKGSNVETPPPSLPEPPWVGLARRRWRPWMAAPLAVIVLAIVLKSRHKPLAVAATGPAPVLTVAAAPVTVRSLSQAVTVTGSVAPWDLISVYPAISGLQVTRMLVDEGDVVRQGQVMALLDDAALRAQVAAAEARVANAAAQRAKMREPNRLQDIAQLQAAVMQAEANVDSAADSQRRTAALLAEGAVSPAEATAKLTALAAARAAAEQTKQRLSLARAGSRREDLQIAEAGLAAEEANLRQLQVQLSQTRVTAPVSGLVMNRTGHLDDVSGPGLRLFQLVRDGRYELQAQVPDTELAAFHPGESATITSDADPGLRVQGQVRIISPAVDATSRQGLVRIDLPPQTALRPGMFVRATVDLGMATRLAVPAAAVQTRDGAAFVFVLDGDVVHSRRIEPDTSSGTWLGVRGGLSVGERIVVAGGGYLKDGDRVRVAPALAGDSDAAAVPALGSDDVVTAAAASDAAVR